jgi:hypothetical protein
VHQFCSDYCWLFTWCVPAIQFRCWIQFIKFEPLLFPFWSLNIVHSSIFPNGWNNCLTSSSVCCLLSMPTKSFLSSVMIKTTICSITHSHHFSTKFTSPQRNDLSDDYRRQGREVVFQEKNHTFVLLFILFPWLRLKNLNKRGRDFSFNWVLHSSIWHVSVWVITVWHIIF